MTFCYKEYRLLNTPKIKVRFLVILLWFSASLYGQERARQIPFILLEEKGNISGHTFVKQAQPLPAGYTIKVREDTQEIGHWDNVGQQLVWRVGFHMPGALGLNAYLSDLKLKDGDSLFIYTHSERLEAAYTKKENNRFFGIGFLVIHIILS